MIVEADQLRVLRPDPVLIEHSRSVAVREPADLWSMVSQNRSVLLMITLYDPGGSSLNSFMALFS